MAFDKIAHLLGLVVAADEQSQQVQQDVDTQNETIDHLSRKAKFLAEKLDEEEDAKRRTLLRYVAHVKQVASEAAQRNNGNAGSHVLHLTESGIGDEEMHALAALLRGNTHITELNLRNNAITNEGARALGAVLSGSCGLQVVDLRDNRIGDVGVRNLAESLERSGRVRHVYVHAGGKIEALGAVVDERWARGRGGDGSTEDGETVSTEAPMMAVSTVCTVDVRNNSNNQGEEGAFGSSSVTSSGRGNNNNTRPANPNTAIVLATSPGPTVRSSTARRQQQQQQQQQIQRRKLSKAEKVSRMKRQAEAAKLRQKEAGWAGSSGGFSSTGPNGSNRSSPARSSSTGELPPIDSRGNSRSGERTANQRHENDEAEELSYVDKARQAAASALPGSKKGKKKKKKKSTTTPFHKRLQASPLMQMQAGKDKGKNRMQVAKK